MVDVRAAAKEVLAEVPETGQITSNGATAATFTRLTGTSHETMKKNWDAGGIMTACNGFVGVYARSLRAKIAGTKAPNDYLGRFDLDTYLPSIGMGHAWVKSTRDGRPGYGDICRHTAFHVGVSLDFDDDDHWNHADAGQGGKGAGCDILKRTHGKDPYDYKNLQGWIDIEMYYTTSPQTLRIPTWLDGWWIVTWRGQTYYYFFNPNRTVKYTSLPPRDSLQIPIVQDDTGTFAVDGSDVTVRWTTGTIERFSKSMASDDDMSGTWRGTEPIVAKRFT
jgi:hypothetical protein